MEEGTNIAFLAVDPKPALPPGIPFSDRCFPVKRDFVALVTHQAGRAVPAKSSKATSESRREKRLFPGFISRAHGSIYVDAGATKDVSGAPLLDLASTGCGLIGMCVGVEATDEQQLIAISPKAIERCIASFDLSIRLLTESGAPLMQRKPLSHLFDAAPLSRGLREIGASLRLPKWKAMLNLIDNSNKLGKMTVNNGFELTAGLNKHKIISESNLLPLYALLTHPTVEEGTLALKTKEILESNAEVMQAWVRTADFACVLAI